MSIILIVISAFIVSVSSYAVDYQVGQSNSNSETSPSYKENANDPGKWLESNDKTKKSEIRQDENSIDNDNSNYLFDENDNEENSTKSIKPDARTVESDIADKMKADSEDTSKKAEEAVEYAEQQGAEADKNIAAIQKQIDNLETFTKMLKKAAGQYQVKVVDVKFQKNAVGVLFDSTKKDTVHFLFGLTAGLIKNFGWIDKVKTIVVVDKIKRVRSITEVSNIFDFSKRRIDEKQYMQNIITQKY